MMSCLIVTGIENLQALIYMENLQAFIDDILTIWLQFAIEFEECESAGKGKFEEGCSGGGD